MSPKWTGRSPGSRCGSSTSPPGEARTASISRTSTCSRSTGAAGWDGSCCAPWPPSASSAVTRGWSGRCWTGTRRRSTSTRPPAPSPWTSGRSSASPTRHSTASPRTGGPDDRRAHGCRVLAERRGRRAGPTGERTDAECWLTDMDGVRVHEEHALPGAAEFLERLVERERRFLVLTNNSIFTPRDLAARLGRSGLHVPEESIWTSALATADFLTTQLPGGSAYVIGEAGLTTALYEAGYTLTDTDPDYVVLGETRTYSFEAITRAIRL